MSTLYHIFRCYLDNPRDSVVIQALNEHDAATGAAKLRGWPFDFIVARYVRTIGDQPYDARDAELRKALEGAK